MARKKSKKSKSSNNKAKQKKARELAQRRKAAQAKKKKEQQKSEAKKRKAAEEKKRRAAQAKKRKAAQAKKAQQRKQPTQTQSKPQQTQQEQQTTQTTQTTSTQDSNVTSSSSPRQDVTSDSPAAGLFNFNSLMSDFYNFQPKEQDETGRALKRGFQSDMIKKFADTQLAQQTAAQDQAFQMDATKQLADLELRNQSQVQKDTFNYGMEEMGARFDYESRMATDDANRELNRMASAGDIQQGQTKLEGEETRQTQEEGLRIGGEEQRKGMIETGIQERKTIGFSDDLAVQREKRQSARAKALAAR